MLLLDRRSDHAWAADAAMLWRLASLRKRHHSQPLQQQSSLGVTCRPSREGCSCALASGLPERELQVGHRA